MLAREQKGMMKMARAPLSMPAVIAKEDNSQTV